jgi:2'-5' RNA ligase
VNEEAQPFAVGHRSTICVDLSELASLVDRWRVPTVRVARCGLPPHITLLFPWRTAPVRAADVAELATAIADVPPFEVTLRRFERFPGHLYLDPEPAGVIRPLIRRLIAAFPDTPPYGGRFPDPVPHVTIAEATTGEELSRLEDEIVRAIAPRLPLVVGVTGGWLSGQTAGVRGSVPVWGPSRRGDAPHGA